MALIAVGFAVRSLGAETSNNLDLPGTDSQAASDLPAERFPPQQNGANPIVFKDSLRFGQVASRIRSTIRGW